MIPTPPPVPMVHRAPSQARDADHAFLRLFQQASRLVSPPMPASTRPVGAGTALVSSAVTVTVPGVLVKGTGSSIKNVESAGFDAPAIGTTLIVNPSLTWVRIGPQKLAL